MIGRTRFAFVFVLLAACGDSGLAPAPSDDDTGAPASDSSSEANADSNGADLGTDGSIPDTTTSDALPEVDAVVDVPEETKTPTCTSTEKFVQKKLNVGAAPGALAVADIDADGDLDVAVANGGDGTVTLLIGHGDGTFEIASPLPVGASPSDVVIADFDGDKKLDIAASSQGTNTVGVLLATAPAKFGAVKPFSVGKLPSALAAGPLNADERSDLVVTTRGDASITVLLATGTGAAFGFEAKAYPVGVGPTDVAITKLDSDAYPDFVVVNAADGTLSLVSGKAGGTWAATSLVIDVPSSKQLVLGDFRSTGRRDIAVTSGASILVFPAIGTGLFGPAKSYPASFVDPMSIAATDFDGDGHLDIASSGSALSILSVGLVSPSTTKLEVPAAAVVTGDFNGDALPDMATANAATNQVTFLLACR